MVDRPITNLPRYHVYFLALVLVSFPIGAALVYQAIYPEWRQVQGGYVVAAQNRGVDLQKPGVQPFRKELRQILVESKTRVDRCTTCHLGVEEDKMRGAPEPFAFHPGDLLVSHPPGRFGCAICHGGRGSATTYELAAHLPDEDFHDPMTPRLLLEARCGACHLGAEVPGAPRLSEGRRVIDEARCVGCHDIPGFPSGPPTIALDGVGEKVPAGWLRGWLQDPASYLPRHRMPRFDLTDREREALVAFLSSRRALPAPLTQVDAGEADPEAGRTLFGQARCISCHSVGGKGGSLAPDLGRVAEKTGPSWLYAYLQNPHAFNANTLMPHYNFADRQILDVVAYMAEEFYEEEDDEEEGGGEGARGAEEAEPDPALVEKGKEIFKDRGCLGCHTIHGVTVTGKIGPDLRGLGSRSMALLDFGPDRTTPRTLPAWIYRKIREPRAVAPDGKMPHVRLTDAQVGAVTVALLSLRTDPIPESLRTSEALPRPFVPQGEFGKVVQRYRCLSCHRMKGWGGDLSQAPLTLEGSRANPDWLFGYLKVPEAIRPLVQERMPRFRMTDAEARTLVSYMRAVFVDDAVPGELPRPATAREVAAGESLYERLGCRSCHILGGAGGYVGPRLDNVGARRRPGWIYAFLKDPQRFKPGTIMPKLALSDNDAFALSAFLAGRRERPDVRGLPGEPLLAVLRLGVTPFFGTEKTNLLYGELTDYLSQAIGVRTELVVCKDFPDFNRRLARGDFDLLYVNPLQYVRAHAIGGYEAIARVQAGARAGVIVARKESTV
ncbi:MAG: c-type cytochrome, partial [Planctomycetota bacterium]